MTGVFDGHRKPLPSSRAPQPTAENTTGRPGDVTPAPTSTPPSRRPPSAFDLALDLAAVARPHLTKTEANDVYVTIGVGETFAAIEALLTVITRAGIPLRPEQVGAVASWLAGYRGSDLESGLHQLLGEVKRCRAEQHPSPYEERFGETPRHRAPGDLKRVR